MASWLPDTSTSLYGIIGHPVSHSLSPAMHNAAFRASGTNAIYLAFDVTYLKGAISGVKALGLKGLSVTIPHKEAIIPLLDEIDPVAGRIGAVNTVINKGERLAGANTDWIGATKALEETIELAGKKALVIGAGGSARAICVGLADKGVKVHIANRTPEKARRIAEICDATWSGLEGWEDIDASILINTTPVGMAPNDKELPVPANILPRFECVMDIVYSPLETALLREAAKAGCRTINGLRMLLLQAVAQFELWTWQPAPVAAMEKALRGTRT